MSVCSYVLVCMCGCMCTCVCGGFIILHLNFCDRVSVNLELSESGSGLDSELQGSPLSVLSTLLGLHEC